MHVPASAGQPMPAAFLNAAPLRDPAPRSVRVIAQARLQRVLEEAARVEVRAGGEPLALSSAEPGTDTTDPEAIHDFRVALRRLRALAQVLQHWLLEVRPARKRIGSDTRGGAGRPGPSALEALRALLARRVATAFRQVHRAIRSPATSAMFTRLTGLIRRLERTELSGNRPVAIGPLLRANSREIHRRFSRGQ